MDGINGSVDIAKEKMHAFRILAIETKMEDRKRIKKKTEQSIIKLWDGFRTKHLWGWGSPKGGDKKCLNKQWPQIFEI